MGGAVDVVVGGGGAEGEADGAAGAVGGDASGEQDRAGFETAGGAGAAGAGGDSGEVEGDEQLVGGRAVEGDAAGVADVLVRLKKQKTLFFPKESMLLSLYSVTGMGLLGIKPLSVISVLQVHIR